MKSHLVLLKNDTLQSCGWENTRKVKTMPSLYATETLNRLVDDAFSCYLKFCGILDQLEGRIPANNLEKGWFSYLVLVKKMETIKLYVESLRRNDCEYPLVQVGKKVSRLARSCQSAVSARYDWYSDNAAGWLPFEEHRSVNNSTNMLDRALENIKSAGSILEGVDKPEFVRVCELRQYIEERSSKDG